MKIINAEWTPKINYLIIKCRCGKTIRHRADRWTVRCTCGKTGNLGKIREKYKNGGVA